MKAKINEKEAMQLCSDGKSSAEIAAVFNCTTKAVRSFLKRRKKTPSRPPRIDFIDKENIRCSICKEIKPLDKFRVNNNKKTGTSFRFSFCKACCAIKLKEKVYEDLNSYLRYKYHRLKSSCKSKNIPFNIDENFLLNQWMLQDGKCFYLNKPLVFEYDNNGCDNRPSIDKIIPELGYIVGNIVICTQRANLIKNNLSLKELKEIIPSFYEKIVTVIGGD